jgi:sugar phosphate isomerase/epimerase
MSWRVWNDPEECTGEVFVKQSSVRPRLGLVTEPFADRPLEALMDWVVREVPQITDLEIGAGAYAPTAHCDAPALLASARGRDRWLGEIRARGLRVAALNVWGNPLHPDPGLARAHDQALRTAIRLAAELAIPRVVALAGCPAGADGDRAPHFAAGGWLPYLEGVHEKQWKDRVAPYWASVSEFAAREHPGLLICLELHPGTVVYNVETYGRLARLGANLAANIDPSHLFWMHMDARAVIAELGDRVGHSHAKDLTFNSGRLAVNGLLDHRWPRPPEEMPWNFATVGRGRGSSWWRDFVRDLASSPAVEVIAIEHEDPFVAAEEGVREAALVLAPSVEPAPASP